MRKYLLPLLLILAGICLAILSARFSNKPIKLTEVSGSISNSTSSKRMPYRTGPHHFWLREYKCTFLIPATRDSDLDPSVFDRSFQDTSLVYVKIPDSRQSDLQVNGAVIPVYGLNGDNKVYLEESNKNFSFHFNPALLFMAILSILAALIILIIFLIKEVKTY